jgi:ABC-type transporter Mla subunit MlaD
MSRSANHNVNRVGAATDQIAQTVTGALRDIPENLRHLNEQIGQRTAQGLDAVGSVANDAIRQGRDSLQRIEGVIENRVRTQPLRSLLVAVGIGAAIALIMRPRR